MVTNTPRSDQAPAAPAASVASRKQYERPVLLQWGSLVDITRGPAADIQDDGFAGSGGV
jgi:hypothetical protein